MKGVVLPQRREQKRLYEVKLSARKEGFKELKANSGDGHCRASKKSLVLIENRTWNPEMFLCGYVESDRRDGRVNISRLVFNEKRSVTYLEFGHALFEREDRVRQVLNYVTGCFFFSVRD